jgi:hypothetical protein
MVDPSKNLKYIINGILTKVSARIVTIKIIGPIVKIISLKKSFIRDNKTKILEVSYFV